MKVGGQRVSRHILQGSTSNSAIKDENCGILITVVVDTLGVTQYLPAVSLTKDLAPNDWIRYGYGYSYWTGKKKE